MKCRCDEAYNRHSKKVRVKAQQCFFERYNVNNWLEHLRKPKATMFDNYYWYYDEDEVYHFENILKKGKVIYTVSASSPYEAIEKLRCWLQKKAWRI